LLAAAWLLSTAYLYALAGRSTAEQPARLHPALLAAMAALGLLTTLAAAWQTPALFS
jgi:hypothetical protein